jgi:hypothetical protein
VPLLSARLPFRALAASALLALASVGCSSSARDDVIEALRDAGYDVTDAPPDDRSDGKPDAKPDADAGDGAADADVDAEADASTDADATADAEVDADAAADADVDGATDAADDGDAPNDAGADATDDAGTHRAHTGAALAAGGVKARSAHYQIVTTLGQAPGGNANMSSPSYRLKAGLVGATQKP